MSASNDSGLLKWVKIGLAALILQCAGWIGSTIWGYATLFSEVNHVRSLLEDHTHAQDQFVRTDVWETRNQFIDAKLDRVETKIDELIKTIEYEGIYVEPGARARMSARKKGGDE